MPFLGQCPAPNPATPKQVPVGQTPCEYLPHCRPALGRQGCKEETGTGPPSFCSYPLGKRKKIIRNAVKWGGKFDYARAEQAHFILQPGRASPVG